MTDELSALDPVPQQVKLESGVVVVLEPLRSRQFFKLLRIITHGALPHLKDTSLLTMEGSQEDFVVKLLTITCMAIPEAEDETIEFLRSMVRPVGLIERRGLNKADKERNEALWLEVDVELDNPSLDDLVTLVEAIVKREAADIQALGKRLASMMTLAVKTGQIKSESPSPRESTLNSSEDSPEPSTSSPLSTADTANKRSTTSRSVGSARSSRKSVSGSTTRGGSGSNG